MAGEARRLSGLISYDIFDAAGRRIAGFDRPGKPAQTLPSGAGADDSSQISIRHSRTPGEPTDVATIATPVMDGAHHLGTMMVALDQSSRAQILRDGLGWTASMMMLLLVFGVGAIGIFAWTRNRESRAAAERARYFAQHDPLTQLPNRSIFIGRLDEALAGRKADTSKTPVVRLNIDRFRQVNDVAGPAMADALLKLMVERLKAHVREGDLIARLDGDEFALALLGQVEASDVIGFVDRLSAMFRQPYRIEGEILTCTLSGGVAFGPTDGEDGETLLKNADLALTRAKQDGRDRISFFEAGMDKALDRRRLLEEQLRQALERDEFEIAYQPQVELITGRITGYEALVRWRHPTHGWIAPGHFIAVAEETGLIIPLGEWVLRQACTDAAAWPNSTMVAVNLSPVQFKQGSVSEMVERVLSETGLPPSRLELEITESTLISETEAALAELGRLRALGVSVAMDDFGTGYSSLNYLARFPFNKIKIDRGFTNGLMRDPTISAIVSTIVALGRALGILVTAEGVENAEQAALLRQLGCPQAQGYLYGRPLPLAEIRAAANFPISASKSRAA